MKVHFFETFSQCTTRRPKARQKIKNIVFAKNDCATPNFSKCTPLLIHFDFASNLLPVRIDFIAIPQVCKNIKYDYTRFRLCDTPFSFHVISHVLIRWLLPAV